MATYYVSTSGSDSGSGSSSSPWRTITKAMKYNLKPGDEVIVRSGTYKEAVVVQKDGSAGNYITIRSEVPGGAKIDASGTNKLGINVNSNYIKVEGFDVSGSSKTGIGGSGVHHVEIKNNISHDNSKAGIYFNRSDFLTIDGNEVYKNASVGPSSGISIHYPQAISNDNSSGYRIIIKNNISHDNVAKSGPHSDGNGIILDDFKATKSASLPAYYFPVLVDNNIVYRNGGEGIQVYNTDNATISNNTAWHNSIDTKTNSSWRAELSNENSSNTTWIRNIAVADPDNHKSNAAIESIATDGYRVTGVVWRDNITYNGTAGEASVMARGGPVPTKDSNYLGVDPNLVNPPSNFNSSSGSLADRNDLGASGGSGGTVSESPVSPPVTPTDPETPSNPGSGGSTIQGNSGDNVLKGGDGKDQIYGFAGKDLLEGGGGDDVLVGGSGKDTLVGGAGDDTFQFNTLGHAGRGAGRDVIRDFADGDLIDLAGIDANTGRSGDQAFSFIGSAKFSGVAGQLNYRDGIVSGDVNGDGVADLHVEIGNRYALDANDFLL